MTGASTSGAMISERLDAAGISLDEQQIDKLAAYFSLLVKWNRVYNLTGIRRVDQLLDRNLLECLALRSYLRGQRIADVGTGAGLPGVPLAIAEPQREFTLIESRAKRVRFLRHVIGALPLPNAVVEHSRAEDLPSGLAFDTVLARAVAPPLVLLDIARHLLAPGSHLLILTSVERSESFRTLAADFEPISIEPLDVSGNRSSVIVQLERIRA